MTSPKHPHLGAASTSQTDNNPQILSFQPTLSANTSSMSVCPSSVSTVASTSMGEQAVTSVAEFDVELCVSSSFTYEDKDLWTTSFAFLNDFYQSGQFCDVEIHVGSLRVSCHRIVLACFSQYFRSMFTSEMSECWTKEITIHDVDENAFLALINFAYTSKITMTTENVQTLLYACSILQVDSVTVACCKFMATHLHPSNCVGVRNFAEQHGLGELVAQADEFIINNFQAVVASSEEFRCMTLENLMNILSSSLLNIRSEIEAYEAVISWVKTNVDEKCQYLRDLVSRLRLSQLPLSYLVDKVSTEELIRKDTTCRDFVDEAKHYQMSLVQLVPNVPIKENFLPRKSYAGVLFCVGGRGASGTPFKTIECYDPRKNHWFQVAEMSTRRRHVGVVAVGGKLYAVGGHDGSEHLKSGEVFDPATNRWQQIAPMSKLRRGIALAHLNGPVYAVGGLDDMACFNIVERYDPDSDTWTAVQNMTYARGGVAVAAFRNYLYAIGGNNGTASLDTCERYDPHLNKWTTVESMKKRRAGAGVAELHGCLYVVGGFDDNSPLDSVERYSHDNHTWTPVMNMLCPRGGVGVAALGGRLYAVGGHDGSNYLSSVEEYDPCLDRWTYVANIGTCRAGAGVAVVSCFSSQVHDVSKANPTAGICSPPGCI